MLPSPCPGPAGISSGREELERNSPGQSLAWEQAVPPQMGARPGLFLEEVPCPLYLVGHCSGGSLLPLVRSWERGFKPCVMAFSPAHTVMVAEQLTASVAAGRPGSHPV